MSDKKIQNNPKIEKMVNKILKDIQENKKLDATPKEFAQFLEYGLENDLITFESYNKPQDGYDLGFTIKVKTK